MAQGLNSYVYTVFMLGLWLAWSVLQHGGRAYQRRSLLALCRVPSRRNHCPTSLFFVALSCVTFASLGNASSINLSGTAQLAADAHYLTGNISLHLNAQEAIYNTRVVVKTQGAAQQVYQVYYWEPEKAQAFAIKLESAHPNPGRYHAIVEVLFQDHAGAHLSVVQAFEYVYDVYAPMPTLPSVTLVGNQLKWKLASIAPASVQLDMTSSPAWTVTHLPLTPKDSAFTLIPNTGLPASPNRQYSQLARLQWIANGMHDSVTFNWTISTDRHGSWRPLPYATPPLIDWHAAPWWRQPLLLSSLALLLACVAARQEYLLRRRFNVVATSRYATEISAFAALIILTIWLISHAHPDLWVTRTWATGGDTGSHIFYARVFADWLSQGKISGWMPESFAGFPAFTYYFPLPFTLISILATLLDFKIAFKLIAMLPVFLLPAATYGMTTLMRWPISARLLAAAACAGFILSESTSIWGGNVLATLAGEFSYAWGMVFAALFWGTLSWSLRNGGRRWLLAVLLEVLLAFSHGYALLIAGFGAFGFVLLSRHPWRDMRIVLQVHTLAFLLIGVWLMPLAQNLPWTIPNDTAAWVDNIGLLWPSTLWPFALGTLFLPLILIQRQNLALVGPLIIIGLLAFAAFLIGHNLGLAEIRFFPYAQWAAALLFAAALGLLLTRVTRTPLLWTTVIMLALMAWWEPRINLSEGWARWNLEGYEAKPMWPIYQQLAKATAGPISAPRVAFEHDPANDDLGSTRTLEALPLFGSRPMLEGLYMESAITSPFIYQLQAEISAKPSAPLSRFPILNNGIEHAVHHMQELYTDTLILRSESMKALYAKDPRFEIIASPGPFYILKLKDFAVQLIEPVTVPLTRESRHDWLRKSFQRFSLQHSTSSRQVYVDSNETLPPIEKATHNKPVKILSVERERIVFETYAIGQPHLIRMSYHPRWQSLNGEHIFLTEPSFMLIIPKQARVELIYGDGLGNTLGKIFSVLGIVLFIVALVLPKFSNATLPNPIGRVSYKPIVIFASVLILVVTLLWWTDPQRYYQRAHGLFSADQWLPAAALFDSAYQGRNLPGDKAEALFWSARSHDLGGEINTAIGQFTVLIKDYPENYWVPESMHRLVSLNQRNGNKQQAEEWYQQLVERFPENKWTAASREMLQSN